ncbi:MAG: ATP-binding protein [Mycobacteriales bacterium]
MAAPGLAGGMDSERVEIDLPATGGQVSQARQAVRNAARRWGLSAAVTEDLALATSELVTNAVVHAGPHVRLCLSRRQDCLRLEVGDEHPQRPTVSCWSDDAAGGRGLHILRAISTSWGIEPAPRGKTVWAELPLVRA